MSQSDRKPANETISLRDFAGSLMPGAGRTDNLLKFLVNLDEKEIASFFTGLFTTIQRVVDGEADTTALETYLIEQETNARTLGVERRRGPAGLPEQPLSLPAWAPLQQPLGDTRVALLGSGAIRRSVDQPYIAEGYDYDQAVANPSKAYDRNPALRIIPADTDSGSLLVEHIAYDISAALLDVNVVFPIDRLRELVTTGDIGATTANHYAFSGLTNLKRLTEEAAPAWAEQIIADGGQAVVLVPG